MKFSPKCNTKSDIGKFVIKFEIFLSLFGKKAGADYQPRVLHDMILFTMLEKQLVPTIQFVDCLSVNRKKRENIEVHLNEFRYCSFCAEISPWAEISAETLIIL